MYQDNIVGCETSPPSPRNDPLPFQRSATDRLPVPIRHTPSRSGRALRRDRSGAARRENGLVLKSRPDFLIVYQLS